MIAAYMKLACSTVFVCSNYSTSFRSDDFSSIKEFGQVGETAKK